VGVLAHQAARRAVKNQLRAQGLRVHELTARELTLRAEIWLAWHPELIAEAREEAQAKPRPQRPEGIRNQRVGNFY